MTGEGAAEVEHFGIRLPDRPGLFVGRLREALIAGRYEAAERRAALHGLEPGERVLDLGAGAGFITATLARAPEVESVLAVEPDPRLLPVLEEVLRLNAVAPKVRLLHGVLLPDPPGATVPFHQRRSFWASSLDAQMGGVVATTEVPAHRAADLLEEARPTLVVADIEGAELDLLPVLAEAPSVRRIVVELHPNLYGEAGLAAIFRALLDRDFLLDVGAPRANLVLSFVKLGRGGVVKPAGAV